MWIFVVGIPIVGALTVYLGHVLVRSSLLVRASGNSFGFVFTLIAVTSTGLTAITSGGALGKLTQITYGVVAPGNVTTNLMTAGITSEVSLNASNLLMDIKPSYMLRKAPPGSGPRLGNFCRWSCRCASILFTVPRRYIFIHFRESSSTRGFRGKGVSEVLTKGLSNLHPTAQSGRSCGSHPWCCYRNYE